MEFNPQLGQTPRWELAHRAHLELHSQSLRLSPAQGSRLVNILGVTHIAVGQIAGTRAKCSLTYQLYAVPARKAVGPPIKLAGTEEQVVVRLPEAARAILTGLGISTPHVPGAVGATAADIRAIVQFREAVRISTNRNMTKQSGKGNWQYASLRESSVPSRNSDRTPQHA
jgi:hypothetical protein